CQVGVVARPGSRPAQPAADPLVTFIPGIAGSREPILVVQRIHQVCELKLLQVAHAGDAMRLGLRLGQCRQQQSGQNGDDGNHDEQFDQGKRGLEVNSTGSELVRTQGAGNSAFLHNGYKVDVLPITEEGRTGNAQIGTGCDWGALQ